MVASRPVDAVRLAGEQAQNDRRVLKAIEDAGLEGIKNADLAEQSGVDRREAQGHAEALEKEGKVWS